jgi:hypothetical protein
MKRKAWSVCIALVAGLALAALALGGGPAAAGTAPPEVCRTGADAAVAASWSSPWVAIPAGSARVFRHNLGGDPDDYAVEMWFRDTDDGLGINRRGYGGLEYDGNKFGAHWQELTANTIKVYRQPEDNGADFVRVRVWIPTSSPGDYESGWTDIDAYETITFTHDLKIPATDLSVGLWFSGTARGIHQYSYGGLTLDGPAQSQGASWHSLSDTIVRVTRSFGDNDVEQERVAVVHADPPDYDSGWEPIAAGVTRSFTHDLNYAPHLLLVRAECQVPPMGNFGGIHQVAAGGDHHFSLGWQGAYLRNLTGNSVAISRLEDDQFCPEVRVRIWKRQVRVYLPIVLRGP